MEEQNREVKRPVGANVSQMETGDVSYQLASWSPEQV